MAIADERKRKHRKVAAKMEIRKQLKVSTLDPFTLLEVAHTLRELPCGEVLELTVEEKCDTEDLFRILAPEKYWIVQKQSETKTGCVQFVIDKLADTSPYGRSCCG
jgi:TusA-related sulfurtransferase